MQKLQKISSIAEAFSYLLGLVPNLGKWKISPSQREYRLERMRLLLERLDHPHLAYHTLHVAGTKGKGSTAAFLASALDAAGYQTGLYTSPHVSDPAERISISKPSSGHTSISDLVHQIQEVIAETSSSLPGSFQLTAFELVTLLAFLYFRATECRFAVIEAGIGGRLDATNVIQPEACLFTPVELEHTDVLGKTIERIAREKSGIIKSGVPVFSGFQVPEVQDIFAEASSLNKSPICFLEKEIETLSVKTSLEGTDCVLGFRGMTEQKFKLKLLGDFQAENAALASLTIAKVFPHISVEAMATGFEKTFLPGRMELIQMNPPVMLDGAHTPFSIARLSSSFRKIFQEKGILIFGAVSGKRTEDMAQILAPGFREILISTPGYFKESDPEDVFRIFKRLNPHTILEKEPGEALQRALKDSQDTLPILVTGSFYLISEIRKLFL